MALKEQIEHSGGWLFRWRSFWPLVLVGFIAMAMLNYNYLFNSELADNIWEAVCLLVSFFGLGIRVWTIGCIPARTSGRNRKRQIADKLNTTGIYSLVRHPLYLGNFFMMLGIVMFTHHIWVILVYCLLFVVYYERIMCAEEAFLKEKFGEEYLLWAEKTPAVIPRFSAYRPPELRFSLKNVLRREYNGFFAVVVSMFVLELASDWVVTGRLELDPFWAVFAGFGLVAWIVLRFIRKYTRWFEVSGR
jgi:protein-S-isoprenylcysteine O-methyltransferase Ste14